MPIFQLWKRRSHRDPARQPLLSPRERVNPEGDQSATHEAAFVTTPLPRRQLVVLCLMRVTEPISQSLIQPFINQMLEDLEVTPDRTKIGFYAGLITSLFAFSQLCTTFWWGMLSDRIGRKPILLSGLIGLSISITSFGVQTSFTGLVVARCFAGIMNGNVGIVKSVLAEITDETNKARAFSLLPMSNAIGMILGPMIGGYLAQPTKQYPEVFGNIEFLNHYPYFLPCFIAGITNLLAVVLGFFYLEETLPSKKAHQKSALSDNNDADEVFEALGEDENVTQTKPKFSALFTPTVVSVLLGSMLVFFQTSSWNTLIPIFAYTRYEDGGLGLNFNQIGTALTTNGFASVIVQTAAFPYFQKKWGTVRVFRKVLAVWPVAFALLPVIRWLERQQREHYGEDVGSRAAVVGLICVLALKSVGGMSMVCIALLINSAAPSPSTLGALYGLAQTCSAFSRTFAPVINGAIFSISINRKYLGGNLVWVWGVLLSCLTYSFSQTIKIESSVSVTRSSTSSVGNR
ncbi:hypothetical protein PTTG_05566 [Puccinia triticina 1-1 BBBD Race 1]|uniref:MFS domain-containing protein n=2 Tax=Puccinia triticina TaxID=208348 RepID=A0A180G2W5_PUCT1|nr:uncharacterized protein PtA15_12A436 [Puccinia triticina]OAV86762.1 hypothetical protein PTTG_05566 [Puccinia triticina 1-1 BBBD Race 1]WAQ90447.1 hypothetical protein PtA15_12A436 [Puccinia triticina]